LIVAVETAETPLVIVKPSVLAPQKVSVGTEGELVTITIGNSTLRIGYEDALKLSQWVRMRAKQAKKRAGDESRHWSALAILDGVKV